MKRFLCLLALISIALAGCGGDAVSPLTSTVAPIPESFVDPTATLDGEITFGRQVFVAPFVQVLGRVEIGDDTNLQDNVTVTGPTALGDNVILAHGCTVTGPARIGAPGGLACFVGFNGLVEGAIMEPDTMVSALGRLGPGVTLHQGTKILPGKSVSTQQEADNPALGKVAAVTDADRKFMADVLLVNQDLAVGYAQKSASDPQGVRGIGSDPPTALDLAEGTPTLDGVPTLDPTFRNRVVGPVFLADTLEQLSLAMGNRDSIRADEGGPFEFGPLGQIGDEVTFHALEHSEISVGTGLRVGQHAVIHGGEVIGSVPPEVTHIADNVTVGPGAVLFRSDVGDDCIIGEGALVDGCQLAPGTEVPAKTILIQNQNLGNVEW